MYIIKRYSADESGERPSYKQTGVTLIMIGDRERPLSPDPLTARLFEIKLELQVSFVTLRVGLKKRKALT